MGNSGFAQARKAMDKNVVKGLMSAPCSFNEDFQVVFNPLLTDKFSKAERA